MRRARTGPLAVAGLLLGATGAALIPAGVTVASGAGGVCMGVVVDYGAASSTVVAPALAATGVTVPAGTSDLNALNSSGHAPGLNDSGLVCSIDNYPADGVQNCLSASNGEFYYWSYYQGDPYTNTWTYASVGPASHTVNSGDTYVEGWRYQNPGPDNPTAPKPSMSPATAFAAACPGVTPVPANGSGGGSSGSPAPTTTVPPSPAATTSTVPATGSGGGGAETKSASGPGATGKAPATSTAHATGTSGATSTTTSHPEGGAAASSVTPSTEASSGAREAQATAVRRVSGGGGNPVLPVVLVGLVVLALGGLAWFRWRRRPAEE